MNKVTTHNLTHNEGGYGYNPYEAEALAEAEAKTEARIQHIIANIGTYKAAWAAAVAKHSVNGQIPSAALVEVEKESGVTLLEIQIVKGRMA